MRADASGLDAFVERVWGEGRERYRDLPWRRTNDAYAVLVSEVMLQQTQVPRVLPRYERWMDRFPTFDALAAAPLSEVLAQWEGLGYNRRAVALKRIAETIADDFAGVLPDDEQTLRSLPGVGPATAAGLLAFAFDRPSVYLETNVRAVFLHELFADEDGVPDKVLLPLVSDAVEIAASRGISPRQWYYALLDYGVWLKKAMPNPSRRSAHHTRQSPYEGSRRQKRAKLLRALVALGEADTERLAEATDLDGAEAESILADLAAEGFAEREGDHWRVGR